MRESQPPTMFRSFVRCEVHRAVLSGLFAVAIQLGCAVPRVDADDVSFDHDVMAVLSKAGCNLGTCHGNARGKGGFQISLRGQDPERDFAVLTHDWLGRRTNSSDPDRSLLLLKPTMQVAHEGGRRFEQDSDEYRILRAWIAAGTPRGSAGRQKLVRLQVTPREAYLERSRSGGNPLDAPPIWNVQLSASAEFSDSSTRDVTSQAVYEMAQPIAEISRAGFVTSRLAGEVTVIVRYLDQQVPVQLAFVSERPGFAWAGAVPANVVDEPVFAKLKRLKINPSPVTEDATFIRRLYQDLLGILPTADEARQFVADRSPSKRADLIDRVLERPEFADWWALKWADLLRVEEKTLDRKGVENFHGWLRDSFATNKPLNRLVREIVAAQGSTYEVPPANFYRALRNPFERSEAVGQLFLGARLQCAKCHNHPFDRWTQDDYYSWGSTFARIDYKIVENNRRDTNDQHEFDGEQIVFVGNKGEAKDPRIERTREARFLGAAPSLAPSSDPLRSVAEWLTAADNDRFVQMLANRTWQQVVGRGIVDPVDDFRATNPASNPELLQVLCDELRRPAADSRAVPFDLRHVLRLILNSRTYQASSEPNETNRDDESNFSHAFVRRHTAEQLLDSCSQVLGVPVKFAGYPTGPRAAQLPGVRVGRRRENGPTEADQFLTVFGKPARLQSCDCERSDETTLTQTFQLVSGGLVQQLLSSPDNRLASLTAAGQTPADLVSELYWTALTRPPTSEELQVATRYLSAATNRRLAMEDLVWGMMNSHEFLLRR